MNVADVIRHAEIEMTQLSIYLSYKNVLFEFLAVQ